MKRLAAIALVTLPSMAAGHGGTHILSQHQPGWSFSPLVILPLLVAALLYAVGYARLRARSEGGRTLHRRNAALFAAGWLALAAALVTPLHQAGERSFALHMVEHELIMVGAAPLLALARPIAVMLWAFPTAARQALAGTGRTLAISWMLISHPVAATMLQGLAMILWHAPPLFNRVLGHEGWHIAQHLSFLVSSLIFWWAMMRRQERPRGYWLSALCLFATSLLGAGLGALMAFASSPWYAGYVALGMTPLGLSPIEDQQLAGMLMWVPGGMVHAGAALILLSCVFRHREARHAPALN
jgi:cytochrome c oxidase assembly factor CtaG